MVIFQLDVVHNSLNKLPKNQWMKIVTHARVLSFIGHKMALAALSGLNSLTGKVQLPY
jgi:hypothetical protein